MGSRWLRFVRSTHSDALGAAPGRSRFSDPMLDRGRTPRWLPMYFGETFTLCLRETLLRDRANAALTLATCLPRDDRSRPVILPASMPAMPLAFLLRATLG